MPTSNLCSNLDITLTDLSPRKSLVTYYGSNVLSPKAKGSEFDLRTWTSTVSPSNKVQTPFRQFAQRLLSRLGTDALSTFVSPPEVLSLSVALPKRAFGSDCTPGSQLDEFNIDVDYGSQIFSRMATGSEYDLLTRSSTFSSSNYRWSSNKAQAPSGRFNKRLLSPQGTGFLSTFVSPPEVPSLSAALPKRAFGSDTSVSSHASSVNGFNSEDMVVPPEFLTPSPRAPITTTFMMRNLPNRFTRERVLDELYSAGFSGRFDFLYLPVDFRCGRNFGYCFINLVDRDAVVDFFNIFNGRKFTEKRQVKVCDIQPSKVQGQLANAESIGSRMLNMKEEFRPLFFKDGKEIEAPGSRGKRTDANSYRLNSGGREAS